MIKLFSSNKIIVSILFLPILAFLAGIDFYQGSELNSSFTSNYITSYLFEPFESLSRVYQYILSIVLIFIQLILITFISNKHQLQKTTNLLVGLFYLIYIVFMPQPLLLNASLIANFFIIGAIDQVLESYKKHKAFGNILNAGFYIGIASLLNPVLLIIFLWSYIGILQLRSFKTRERILLLVAVLIPYYLLGSWMFFQGNLNEFFNRSLIEPFALKNFFALSKKEIISLMMIFTAAIVLLFNYRIYMIKRSMVVQRKISSLFFFFLCAIVLVIFSGFSTIDLVVLLAIPMSILSAILSQNSNPKWAELITVFLVLNILCLRFEFILSIFGLN